MRIIIVGGGNVGYYLVKTLMAEKHHIMLIDSNRARCERVENAFGGAYVEVTHGDGTTADCLRDAGIYHAEALIAVTGQDQNNLVSCELAKDYFGVKRTIARVKNPKNIRVFEQLGVDSVISSTARIAGSIDSELDWADVNTLLTRKATHVRVREALVDRQGPFGALLELATASENVADAPPSDALLAARRAHPELGERTVSLCLEHALAWANNLDRTKD